MTEYKGDKNLVQLLTKAKSPYSVDEIKDLIKGHLSAPEDMSRPLQWLILIAPKINDEFKTQLIALESNIKDTIKSSQPKDTMKERLLNTRKFMKDQNIDGFIIPRSDEFQGEYVPLSAERLAWATGFSGSAGSAILLQDTAAFFTDGRYTIAAKEEVLADLFNIYSISKDQGSTPTLSPYEWVEKNMSEGDVLAYDPWLHTKSQIKPFIKATQDIDATLVPCTFNPLDAAWGVGQPPPPISPAVKHPLEFSGKTSSDKRKDLSNTLKDQNIDATVLTLPEDIAWLLNIRGNDVPCTPLPLSFAIAHNDNKVDLFIDERKLAPDLKEFLGKDISIYPIEDFKPALNELSQQQKSILLDPATTSMAIFQSLDQNGTIIVEKPAPCQLAKACKNPIEVQGTIDAHIRDGVALTRFLARMAEKDAAETYTEMTAADLLQGYRSINDNFRGLSFDTISGMGSNGAIVHYRVTHQSDKPLSDGEIFLVDSGGQYLDGTTDVTRTMAMATPTAEMKDRFTRVLKGHIQVALSEFKAGTAGDVLDDKARASLKEIGLDFAHGTGHGVGSYLSVHEGPQGISPRAKTPFQEGMIVSNEPGFYKEGEYGIRIESLVVVEDAGMKDNAQYFKFKTITMAPIDKNLINVNLLDETELKWLNDYHEEVRNTLTPHLDKIDKAASTWLCDVTEPLNYHKQKTAPKFNHK